MAKFKCNIIVFDTVCYEYFKKLGYTDTIVINEAKYCKYIVTVKDGKCIELYCYRQPHINFNSEEDIIEMIEINLNKTQL